MQSSVDSLVKSSEENGKDPMKENIPQANDPNTGILQGSLSKSFMPHKFLRCPGHVEYILRPNFKISLYSGDILQSSVDAICCGQDPYLKSEGHIASNIISQYKGVGKQLLEARKKHGYYIGEVIKIECNADSPKCFLFIVTESPSARETTRETLESIKMCFLSVLEYSDQHNIASLALPRLGAGNSDAPREAITQVWFESVLEFMKKDNLKLKELHLVQKSYKCLKTVEECFDKYCCQTGTKSQ